MAEASVSRSTGSTVCPFCDAQLNSKEHLKQHLKEIHEISVRLLTKYSDGSTKVQECYPAMKGFLKDSDLGNKLKVLKSVLNENFAVYLQHMKRWIRCEITRGEFDENVRPLFTFETIVAHNEFLISFLKEIRSISKSAVWKNQFSTLQDLDSIESASELMKNMYMAIMMRRKNFKVRADGFVYDVGKVDPNEVNPEDQPVYSGHITLTELLDVLETHPHLIPIKSVYNYTIQTIIGALKEIAENQKSKNESA